MSEILRPLTDPGIGTLSAILDPVALVKHMQGVWPGPRIAGTIHEVQVRLLRHHVGRRCTLEIGLRTEGEWQFLIGKVYHNDRLDEFEAMEKIQRVGFGPKEEFSIPQPFAYIESLRLLLQEKVDGPTAEEVFSSSDEAGRAAAAERCALWLARFHTLAPHVGPVSRPNDYFDSKRMRRCRAEIAKLDGDFAGKADRLLHLLEDAAPSRIAADLCAGHGAYRPDHIILAQGLNHVRAADGRGHGAVAVLGHGHAGGGAQDGAGGGNVERAQPVAAGANDVEDFPRAGFGVERRRNGFLAQRGGKRGDFLRRLAFLRERDEKIRLRFARRWFHPSSCSTASADWPAASGSRPRVVL